MIGQRAVGVECKVDWGRRPGCGALGRSKTGFDGVMDGPAAGAEGQNPAPKLVGAWGSAIVEGDRHPAAGHAPQGPRAEANRKRRRGHPRRRRLDPDGRSNKGWLAELNGNKRGCGSATEGAGQWPSSESIRGVVGRHRPSIRPELG